MASEAGRTAGSGPSRPQQSAAGFVWPCGRRCARGSRHVRHEAGAPRCRLLRRLTRQGCASQPPQQKNAPLTVLFAQASDFRRALQCPGSPRFHSQTAVRWLPVTGGDREGALRLHFPCPMAWSASADGEMPKFGPKRKMRGLRTHPPIPLAWDPGNEDAEGRG